MSGMNKKKTEAPRTRVFDWVEDPMTTPLRPRTAALDHRFTCMCGHRYGDHAKGGTKCLAVGTSDQRTGDLCGCYGWTPLIEKVRA